MDYNFEIVFKKIEEAKKDRPTIEIQAHAAELDEIDALRKIVLETTGPDNRSYTTA